MAVISLFSGAGGIDYGFEAAGFETRVCIDFDADACATLRANRSWDVIEADIASPEVAPRLVLDRAGLRPGATEVLIGGPPCQPFSKSGYWSSGDALRLGDPRSGTLGRYLDFVAVMQPRVLLFENVDALGYEGKDEGLHLLLDGLKAVNQACGTRYEPVHGVIDAAAYGVPQHRSRLFLVAAKDGRAFRLPDATHSAIDLASIGSGQPPYTTAWDAIGDLDTASSNEALAMSGKWADLLPAVPEGQNYLWHTVRGGGEPLFGWRTRFWNFLLKLAKNQPSWTLQAQPGPATGPFHWRNRHLSARELCRLQTFPDDVIVAGDRRAAQKQLGNAVPSLMAEVLARAIRVQLLDLPLVGQRPKLLPPKRLPVPGREPVEAVPEKYKHLIGAHAPHPGEGKGPGATRRRVSA